MSDAEHERIRTDEAGQEIYKLAYLEGLRRLNHQVAEVGALRTRLLQLLTVVTAATAFLAAAGLKGSTNHHHVAFYVFAVLATALYAGLLVVSYLAMQPISGWMDETTPKVLIQDYGDVTAGSGPVSLAETYRNLGLYFERYGDSNDKPLGDLRRRFNLAIILGGAQIVCWVIVVWLVG